MTNIWTPNGNRVAALAPGPDDLFVVTTIFGKWVGIGPVADFDKEVARANDFASRYGDRRPFTIKVLSMSLDDALASAGLARSDFAECMSSETCKEFRQLAIEACTEALRRCDDAKVREEAFGVLTALGGFTQ